MAVILALASADQGSATVPVGDTIRIELTDISTTGYRWQTQDFDHSVVSLLSDNVSPGAAPGASGMRIFNFRAIGVGHTVVRFVLSRPWEVNQAPTRQAVVDITVK